MPSNNSFKSWMHDPLIDSILFAKTPPDFSLSLPFCFLSFLDFWTSIQFLCTGSDWGMKILDLNLSRSLAYSSLSSKGFTRLFKHPLTKWPYLSQWKHNIWILSYWMYLILPLTKNLNGKGLVRSTSTQILAYLPWLDLE